MRSLLPADECASERHQRAAWGVHLFTALGAAVGMLALEAVFRGDARQAMLYLLATQLIDGVDGPLARQLDMAKAAPRVDGYVLDLVIDFFTCVVVPAAFLHEFGLLPDGISMAFVSVIVLLSAIWFSRTDMMTEDLWFNGFPATWNLVAPTLLILDTPKVVNAIACIVLCALMLTDVKFPHPVRSSGPRPATLTFTVAWLVGLTWAALRYPTHSIVAATVVLVSIVYMAGLCAWRTRRSSAEAAAASTTL